MGPLPTTATDKMRSRYFNCWKRRTAIAIGSERVPEQVLGAARPESTLKDADPDIPILKEAKAEYAKLQ
jgi:hypothetical protein